MLLYMEIETLFSSGLTPSQVYNEFLRNLQSNAESKLNFHVNKADRSKCPIRKDFNSSYIKYYHKKFGRNSPVESRNSAEMFDKPDKLMSLWNLPNVLRFLTNFTTKIRTQN